MVYTPTVWQNRPSTATPVSAANLNKIETGIKSVTDIVETGRLSQTSLSSSYDVSSRLTADSSIPNGTTDNRAYLQSIIDSAWTFGVKTIRIPQGLAGRWKLGNPLVVRSDQTIDASKAEIELIASTSVSSPLLVNYSYQNPGRTIPDVTSATGSVVITSPSASFSSADVGRSITLAGAGKLDGSLPLTARIISVTDASTATIEEAVIFGGATRSATIWNIDKNITIIGGMWVRTASNLSPSNSVHNILLHHVDNLTIRDISFNTSIGKYAIFIADAKNFVVDTVRLDTFSDGVHVNGPADGGAIRNIQGYTGDDQVALIPQDYDYYADTSGSIRNIVIENVLSRNSKNSVAIYGSPSYETRNVSVRNVMGTVQYYNVNISSSLGGRVDAITAENLYAISDDSHRIALLRCNNAGSITIKNADHNKPTTIAADIYVDTPSVIDSLVVQGFHVERTIASGNPSPLRIDGYVKKCVLRDVSGTLGTGHYPVTLGASTSRVDTLILDAVVTQGGAALVSATAAGSVLGELIVTNCSVNAGAIAFLAGTTTVRLANSSFAGATTLNLSATAVITLYSSGCSFTGTGFVAASGAKITPFSLEFPLNFGDAAVVQKRNAMASNLTDGAAPGKGPAISDGTAWHTLMGGSTTGTSGPLTDIITDGLLFEFDARTLSLSDGAAVSSWSPKRGAQGSAATQATVSNRPTYIASDLTGPSVKFASASAQWLDTGVWGTDYPVPLTIFVVHREEAAPVATQNILTGAAGGALTVFAGLNSAGSHTYSSGSTGAQTPDATPPWSASTHIDVFVYNGGLSYLWHNSKTKPAAKTTGTTATAGLSGVRLGSAVTGGASFNGRQKHVIGYAGVMLDVDIQRQLDYLAGQWGVTLS